MPAFRCRRATTRVTPREVAEFLERVVGEWVVKAQVLMGGRGKAGKDQVRARAPTQGRSVAEEILATPMPPNRQNPAGEPINSLLVEEKLPIAKEAYCAIAIDRATKKPVIMVSRFGGMDIEEVSEKHPESIAKFFVDTAIGYSPFVGRELAFDAQLDPGYRKQFPAILGSLYDVFFRYGAKLVEVNPLALTADGRVVASDAKVELDDDALFRHPEFAKWQKSLPLDEDERLAAESGLGHSELPPLRRQRRHDGQRRGTRDGDDGRRGLRRRQGRQLSRRRRRRQRAARPQLLRTRRQPHAARRRSSSTSSAASRAATKWRAASSRRCATTTSRKIPLVIRLTGTNEEEGRRILADAGMTPVETMDEGAARAVEIADRATETAPSEHFLRQEQQGHRPRHHRGRRLVSHRPDGALRHERRRRRDARQRRSKDAAGAAGFRHGRAAVAATGATHTCIFVPPPFAADALYEAYDAGIGLAVCITEGVPVHDVLKVVGSTPGHAHHRPNCPGLISPGRASVGIMPGHVFAEGDVGLISRSGTLTYEVVDGLTRAGFGQSTCVGIGGDPIIGTTFVDCLREFQNDPQTKAIVICGEIGGSDEEDAAAYVREHLPETPVVAFVGGRNAPPGKSLGHARCDHLG